MGDNYSNSSRLSGFDLFGTNVNLMFNGQTQIHSTAGLIVSFLSVMLMGLLIFAFGTDFFYRTNPIFTKQTIIPEEYQSIALTNKNFSFAVRFEDVDSNLIDDDTLFYLRAFYQHFDLDDQKIWDKTKLIEVNLKRCTEDMIFDPKVYANNNFHNFFCPDFSELDFRLGGFWDGKFVDNFFIRAYLCEEGSTNHKNQNCRKAEEATKYLRERLYISYYYQNVIVNPSNYNTSLSPQIRNNYYVLDPGLYKNSYFFFYQTKEESDFGWLIKDFQYNSVVGLGSFWMDIITGSIINNGSTGTMLTTLAFYFDKGYDKYYREYPKIQTLAAQVGGILKLFLVLGAILVTQFNNHIFNSTMIQCLPSIEKSIGKKIETPKIALDNNSSVLKLNASDAPKINSAVIHLGDTNLQSYNTYYSQANTLPLYSIIRLAICCDRRFKIYSNLKKELKEQLNIQQFLLSQNIIRTFIKHTLSHESRSQIYSEISDMQRKNKNTLDEFLK